MYPGIAQVLGALLHFVEELGGMDVFPGVLLEEVLEAGKEEGVRLSAGQVEAQGVPEQSAFTVGGVSVDGLLWQAVGVEESAVLVVEEAQEVFQKGVCPVLGESVEFFGDAVFKEGGSAFLPPHFLGVGKCDEVADPVVCEFVGEHQFVGGGSVDQ